MGRWLMVLLTTGCLMLAGGDAGAEQSLRMVSGPRGGWWYPLGEAMLQTFVGTLEIDSFSHASGAAGSNVKAVSRGEAEIGITFAHTAYQGFTVGGKFKKAFRNMRHFAAAYDTTLQVAVRRDSSIRSYADMGDKVIGPGRLGRIGAGFAGAVLREHGLGLAALRRNGGAMRYRDRAGSAELLRSGEIQVLMAMAPVPDPFLMGLNADPGIRFIGIGRKALEQILKTNPGYIGGLVSREVYDGVQTDLRTVAAVVEIIVNKDLPDDLVYSMAEIFWQSGDRYAEVNKIWNSVEFNKALRGTAIPVHPGAQRFYDEYGVRK